MNAYQNKNREIQLEYRAKNSYKNIRIAAQSATIARLKKALLLMEASTSWRLTAPLRKIITLVRK